ncbi:MAG: DMT family transporter [Clostridia bacterium]|nr:DMT family transporter [Clostridia bacterium]
MKNHQLIYVAGLFVVAMFWGLGFPALKFCEDVPTFFIMSFRFVVAAILVSLIFHKKLKEISWDIIKVGSWVGVLNFLCYITATIGIKYTTSARCAFFSCLGAICVPLLNWLFYKVKITKKFFGCITLCVVGVYLISMGGNASIGLNFGDIISLSASIFGAGQLVAIDHRAKNMDNVALTIVSLTSIAILSLICMFILGEQIPTSFTPVEIGSLIFMGVCASAIAFLLQFFCIDKVPSNRACLILTMEPVLGGISSVLILHEVMGVIGAIGGALVAASVVLSEYSSTKD